MAGMIIVSVLFLLLFSNSLAVPILFIYNFRFRIAAKNLAEALGSAPIGVDAIQIADRLNRFHPFNLSYLFFYKYLPPRVLTSGMSDLIETDKYDAHPKVAELRKQCLVVHNKRKAICGFLGLSLIGYAVLGVTMIVGHFLFE